MAGGGSDQPAMLLNTSTLQHNNPRLQQAFTLSSANVKIITAAPRQYSHYSYYAFKRRKKQCWAFLKQDKEACFRHIKESQECNTASNAFISSLAVLSINTPYDTFEALAPTTLTKHISSKKTGGKISHDESVDSQLMTRICQNKSPAVTIPETVWLIHMLVLQILPLLTSATLTCSESTISKAGWKAEHNIKLCHTALTYQRYSGIQENSTYCIKKKKTKLDCPLSVYWFKIKALRKKRMPY